MDRKKVFLLIQSALFILLAVLLIAAAVLIYREGVQAKEDNVLAWIFSREKVADSFRLIRPLFYAVIGTSAVGLILGVRDEDAAKPVKAEKVHNPSPVSRGGIVRAVLLAAAVCLLAAGAFNGSAKDVLGKAINICTECIGLG